MMVMPRLNEIILISLVSVAPAEGVELERKASTG